MLLSLAGAQLTDAFRLAWPHCAALCCALALVDADGAPLAEVRLRLIAPDGPLMSVDDPLMTADDR